MSADSRRGYNLIEMMLALVVLGLVLGGALVPLQVRFEREEINSARDYLAQAKEAVLAYALSTTTGADEVVYFDMINYRLPSNRPYLPCPDVTGDGREDRTALPTTSPVTAAELSTAGICMQLKGMLPWKTLGLRQLDPWGNHLTYRVDKNFSSSLYGFDETFRADIMDVAVNVTIDAGDRYYAPHADRDDAGAIVCSDFKVGDGCPRTDLSNVEAGIVTTEDLTIGARIIPAYSSISGADLQGIIDGAVFVILSHGRDGRGAINREYKCRSAPRLTTNLVETINAHYRSGHPFLSMPFSCAASTAAGLRDNLFVSAPISDIVNAEVDAPDDIVVWGGSKELFGILGRGGRLPLEKLEYLP